MPVRARYPLAALEDLRRRLVDEARAQLGAAVAEGRRETARAEEAERALSAGAERLRAAQEGTQGGTSAALADGARWLERLRDERRRLVDEASSRREAAARARGREDAQREALAGAERQLRAVSRHRELWESERRRRALAAEEAEQDDRATAAAGQQRT